MRPRAREAGAPRRDGGAPLLHRTSCQTAGRTSALDRHAPIPEIKKAAWGTRGGFTIANASGKFAYGSPSWLPVPAVSSRSGRAKAHSGCSTTSADGYRHKAGRSWWSRVISVGYRFWRDTGFRAAPASNPKCSEAAGESAAASTSPARVNRRKAAGYVLPPTTVWRRDMPPPRPARVSRFSKQGFIGTVELLRLSSTSVNSSCSNFCLRGLALVARDQFAVTSSVALGADVFCSGW